MNFKVRNGTRLRVLFLCFCMCVTLHEMNKFLTHVAQQKKAFISVITTRFAQKDTIRFLYQNDGSMEILFFGKEKTFSFVVFHHVSKSGYGYARCFRECDYG